MRSLTALAVAGLAITLITLVEAQEDGFRNREAFRQSLQSSRELAEAKQRFVTLSEQYARLRAADLDLEELQRKNEQLEAKVALLRAKSGMQELKFYVETASKSAEIGELQEEKERLADLVERLGSAAEKMAKQEACSEDESSNEPVGEIHEEAIEQIEERFERGEANDSFPPYTEPPVQIEVERKVMP